MSSAFIRASRWSACLIFMRSLGRRGVGCGSGGGGTAGGVTPGGGLLAPLWLPTTSEHEEALEVTTLSTTLELTILSWSSCHSTVAGDNKLVSASTAGVASAVVVGFCFFA